MSFTFTEETADVLSCDGCTYVSTEKHFCEDDGGLYCGLCRCTDLTKIDSVTVK